MSEYEVEATTDSDGEDQFDVVNRNGLVVWSEQHESNAQDICDRLNSGELKEEDL
jgi:hypothetical protein